MGEAASAGTETRDEGSARPRRTRWISQGVETLFSRLAGDQRGSEEELDTDVLIIGSGYGGAVAADRLAGLQQSDGNMLRVCLLERGLEHLAGAFPSRAAELPGHVRFTTPNGRQAMGKLEGLFDLRVGGDMSVLLGNGVGGGSLINAGVMEFPRQEVFGDKRWPNSLPSHAELGKRAAGLRFELGARPPRDDDAVSGLTRTATMRQLGGRRVPITVALTDGLRSSGGTQMSACIACGDCATGCNHGAKESLDVNLLRRATSRGVELFSGATVSRIRQQGSHWEAEVWHTDATRRMRMAHGHWVSAKRIVLAAGALGSTEILLRSQTGTLQFSQRLGRGFSGNGDVLATVFDADKPIRGVADENQPPTVRSVGPTITSMVDLRATEGYVVQDLGVPGPLRRLFEEASATGALLQQLDQPDTSNHGEPKQRRDADPVAVDPAKVKRSVVVALICRDSASGVMTPVPDDTDLPKDAGLRIDWRTARDDPAIQKAHTDFEARLTRSPVQGRLLPNPIWRLLPPAVESLLGAEPGPLITVHPLGGCGMGDDRNRGVVNRSGEVFDGEGAALGATHQGLLVLDGSIVPTSLGINPALTIATLADVAIRQQIANWGLMKPKDDRPNPPEATRPVYRHLPPPQPPIKTKVQVIERLSGWVDFSGIGARWVELDLVYKNQPLYPGGQGFSQDGHHLQVEPDSTLSRIRIFVNESSHFDMKRGDGEAELVAPLLAGSELHFFHRRPSTHAERRCRAWCAWFKNRGARDLWQAGADWVSGRSKSGLNPVRRWRQSLALASRAGEARLFEYSLKLGRPSRATGLFSGLSERDGLNVTGTKTFTYSRRCNPWTQLMRLTLTDLAGLPLGTRRELMVCPAYFAGKRMPLMRVVEQQDQPSALIDQFAFAAYLARVFINVHVWSLRKPDTALKPRVPQRLPGVLPGLPDPEVWRLQPDGANDDGELQLTAYRDTKTSRQPVLMIHGYSASGTSFAHPALRPSLAGHLWAQGFEPWIVDLRSSSGMPTADRPYTFEEIALTDIPAAIRKVCQLTGKEQVDVISHCMGSAMLSMTLQANAPCGPHTAARIRRWVMSQFGPRLRFSPASVLRSYLVSYFRQAVPDFRFSLRPGDAAPGVDGNLYDRLVATLPYLNDSLGSEFDLENPPWAFWRRTPWVGTRHRLDALIGRTFDARQMSAEALEHIDDFFGPINLRTMSQPIYFAQMSEVSDDRGLDSFGRDAAPLLRHVRMLSLHGMTNGLADPETSLLLKEWAKDNNLSLERKHFALHGHQDTLIGKECADVFRVISDFLK